MKKFILLYRGPPVPANAAHEGWPEWFSKLGDRLVDRGSPMKDGHAMHGDGSTSDAASSIVGYSIIQAADMDEVRRLARDHPILSRVKGYTIEAFDIGNVEPVKRVAVPYQEA